MSKDLSKVKAGDFVKYNWGSESKYGIIIKPTRGPLLIVTQTGFTPLLSNSTHCKTQYEYRRLPKEISINRHYMPKYWERSFKKAESIFKDEIEVDIRINGKKANLSDISEETLIKLRKEN